LKVGESANYASNNGMYIKGDNVRIKRIVLDLHDVIVDSKKVGLVDR